MISALTKATAFKKRTFWLLSPGVAVPALLNSSSFAGFGNVMALTLVSSEKDFRSAPLLAKLLHDRNNANENVKNYGSLSIFEDNSNQKYFIENLSPFDDSIFGEEFNFKKGKIEDSSAAGAAPTSSPSQHLGDALLDKNLKFTKKTPTPKKPDASDEEIASYSFSKESFNSSLKGKSDLNLIVDLEMKLTNEKKMFSSSMIPLNQFVFDNSSSVPLLKIKDKDSNTITDYVLEVKKNQQTSLEMKIKKTTPVKSAGRARRSASPDPAQTNPITELKVRNFFVIFSDNPPVSFENMFEEITEQAGTVFQGPGSNFRKFFLENWKKKSGSGGSESEFEFNLSDAAWKSMCADPYKVGGFIENEGAQSAKPAASKPSTVTKQSTAGQYIKDQKEKSENFNPREHARSLNTTIQAVAAKKHTKAMPCQGLDETTKQGLTGNQDLMPKSLKDKLSSSSPAQGAQTTHSKIIPGSFRAWHDGDQYNSFYEQALTTSHYFEAKISKEKFQSQLLNPTQLTKKEGNQEALNTISEVSTQLQVAMPYTFHIYDHDSQFLKVQKVNLNIDLDLKALYNQSQFTKDFFTYDLAKHHSKIGGESGSEYGLSGTLTFSAGLFLDVEKNLNVRLIVTTKGFVSTKKGAEGKVDLRDRTSNGSKSTEPKPTIPFIVVDVDQDPRISSFYVDRRSGNVSSPAKSAPSSPGPVGRKGTENQQPKTLKELNDNLDQLTIKQLRKFDHTNNAEVFFYEIGAEQEMKDKKLQKTGDVRVNYATPRRNSGSISIDTENLDKITLSLSGSSTLGNKYFNSIFSLAKATVCATEPSSDTKQTTTHECAYASGSNKYQKKEKDVSVGAIDEKIGLRRISVNWSDLQSASEESKAKEFEFLQVVSYYDPDQQDVQKQEDWEKLKTKFGNLFKESSTTSISSSSWSWTSNSSDFPQVSFAAVWYSVKLWHDETNKNLQYHTILRPITAIKYGSSSIFSSDSIDNSNFHKVAGSAARAGFQLGQIELEYKKAGSGAA